MFFKAITLCMLLSTSLLTLNAQTFYGATKLKDITFEELDVYGAFKGTNITITKKANFKGATNIKKSTLHKAEINGACDLKDTTIDYLTIKGALSTSNLTVKKTAKISGAVSLNKTTIEGKTIIKGAPALKDTKLQEVEIWARDILFESVHAKAVLIHQERDRKQQKLELRGNTIIDGDIVCEDANIIIEKDADVIIKGNIVKLSPKELSESINEEDNPFIRFYNWITSFFIA